MCKISELWLKNWACHALLKFELLKGVAASFFEPNPPNFGQACIFIDVQMLLASYFCSSYQKVEIWENLILLSELRLQHVEKLHLVVYIAMKKSVFLKFLLFGKKYKNMILITFERLEKNACLTKIWRVWLKKWGCHALQKLKFDKGVAGSIFEPQLWNFAQLLIF